MSEWRGSLKAECAPPRLSVCIRRLSSGRPGLLCAVGRSLVGRTGFVVVDCCLKDSFGSMALSSRDYLYQPRSQLYNDPFSSKWLPSNVPSVSLSHQYVAALSDMNSESHSGLMQQSVLLGTKSPYHFLIFGPFSTGVLNSEKDEKRWFMYIIIVLV